MLIKYFLTGSFLLLSSLLFSACTLNQNPIVESKVTPTISVIPSSDDDALLQDIQSSDQPIDDYFLQIENSLK